MIKGWKEFVNCDVILGYFFIYFFFCPNPICLVLWSKTLSQKRYNYEPCVMIDIHTYLIQGVWPVEPPFTRRQKCMHDVPFLHTRMTFCFKRWYTIMMMGVKDKLNVETSRCGSWEILSLQRLCYSLSVDVSTSFASLLDNLF